MFDMFVVIGLTKAVQGVAHCPWTVLYNIQVGPVKELTSKGDRKLKRCEVKLFDETHPSFSITL